MPSKMPRSSAPSSTERSRHAATLCFSTPPPRWLPPPEPITSLTHSRSRSSPSIPEQRPKSCSSRTLQFAVVLKQMPFLLYGQVVLLRRRPYQTPTFSKYSASCTFHPNSFFISSRNCRRSVRFSVHQISRRRPVAKGAQPLQQLRRVRMIAELLQRSDLSANGNGIPENLHFVALVLDGEPARPRRLKADKQHQISWIRQAAAPDDARFARRSPCHWKK